MRLPSDVVAMFKAAQKATFQDRTIVVYNVKQMSDSGGAKRSVPDTQTPLATYTDAGVTVVSDAVEATAWGLVVGKDIRVVRSDGLLGKPGDFVLYADKYYRIKSRSDAELTDVMYCEAWQGSVS